MITVARVYIPRGSSYCNEGDAPAEAPPAASGELLPPPLPPPPATPEASSSSGAASSSTDPLPGEPPVIAKMCGYKKVSRDVLEWPTRGEIKYQFRFTKLKSTGAAVKIVTPIR